MFIIDWYLTIIAKFVGYGIDGGSSIRSRELDPRAIIGAFFAFLPLLIFIPFTSFDVSKHPDRYMISLLVVIILALGPPLLLYLRRKQIKQRLKKEKPTSLWRGVVYIVLFFAVWWLLDDVRHLIFG
jgi:uncharacterized membrane protein